MTMETFLQTVAGVHSSHLVLCRCLAWMCFLGLALAKTTPPTTVTLKASSASSAQSPSLPSRGTTMATVSVTTPSTGNFSLATAMNLTNGTPSTIAFNSSTPSPTALVSTAVTSQSATTATSPDTPATKPQQTMQIVTTAPKTSPKTHLPLIPLVTAKGIVVTPTNKSVPHDSRNHIALYLLLPLVIIAGLAMLFMIGSYLRKKIRLDKLRHQLLPLYSFDPQEGEDWETELLTDPNKATSQTPLNTAAKPMATTMAVAEIPKLRFSSDSVDV